MNYINSSDILISWDKLTDILSNLTPDKSICITTFVYYSFYNKCNYKANELRIKDDFLDYENDHFDLTRIHKPQGDIILRHGEMTTIDICSDNAKLTIWID